MARRVRNLLNRERRARHRQRSNRMALLGPPGRGLEARRRARRELDGLQTKLPARSAPLSLATPEVLDAGPDDDGLRRQGWRAEHALRNP
jgi:hypothetical protein